jgi:hypothetical protein
MKDEDWDMDTITVWHIALNDLGITADEFLTAKRKSLGLTWPPTAPTDFLALARTEQVSRYPTAEDAFNIACSNCGMKGDVKRKWKHGVIYETANRIGWGRLASANEYFIKTFKATYDQVCSEYDAGNTFVIPENKRLPHNHTVVQADSPFNATLDAFFAKNGSKTVTV